jgi:hypothetical protein
MVYRPSKKKTTPALPGSPFPANRPDADPLEGPLQGVTRGDDLRQGDDRNLVEVDQNFAEADMEDRAWLFWRKYRGVVQGLVILVALAVIGWGAWHFYQKEALAQTQAGYQQAVTGGDLLAFGRANAGTPLGQIALVEGADALYTKGQFKEAAAAYAEASTAWTGQSLNQRIRMGQALSLVRSDDTAGGQQALEAIVNDGQVTDNFRAEAGYYLAVLALKAGDSTGARSWIERVGALPEPGVWGREATDLAQLAPVLGLIKASTPSLAPETSISAPGLSPFSQPPQAAQPASTTSAPNALGLPAQAPAK